MRILLAVLVMGVVATVGWAAEKAPELETRYGITADLKKFPQAEPKEAMASVLEAIADKRIDYLLAQLSDPDFVDRRVKETGGHFADLVEETTGKLLKDPGPAKLLQRFLKEGTWDIQDDSASAHLKDVPDRVYLRRIEGRWFLENRRKPEPEPR